MIPTFCGGCLSNASLVPGADESSDIMSPIWSLNVISASFSFSFSLSNIMHFNYSLKFVLSLLVLGLDNIAMGQALGAFYSSLGPGVVVLDPVNRQFMYNFCSETGFHQMNRITPNVIPKNSTDIAVTGYSNGQGIYVSNSIYYFVLIHLLLLFVVILTI